MFKGTRAFIAVLVFCGALAVSSASAWGATSIGTTPSSSFYTCSWGVSSTANPAVSTFGQSIVAPTADTVLDSFTFYVTKLRDPLTTLPVGDGRSITYRAYVAQWDPVNYKTVGAPVWSSGNQTLTTTDGSQAITVQTGGLQVQGGAPYVLFFSTSETLAELDNVDGDVGCWFGAVGDMNAYPDGHGLFINNGSDTTQWANQSWAITFDTAFQAAFSGPSGSGGGETPPPTPSVYNFDGFYAPVNNKDSLGNYVLNRVNAGAAIPVKFSLGGDHGLDVFEAGYPKSETIACNSQAEVNGIDQTVNAGASSLSYDAGSDTYNYVWKTDKAWADACRQLVVKFNDGTTARANFTFK